MRGKINYLDSISIVSRARSLINAPILYHLEYPNGGTDPDASDCSGKLDDGTKVADCIGFATWAAGFDRYNPDKFPLYDGYINTDSMVEEALENGKWFKSYRDPVPGLFIVAPTFRRKLPPWNRVIGHIGVISAVNCGPSCVDGIRVVHCSPGNYGYTNSKSAIYETSAQPWFNYPAHYYIGLNLTRPATSATL